VLEVFGADKKYMKERKTMKVKYFVVTLIIFFLMATTYAWAVDTTFSSGMTLLSNCEKYDGMVDGQTNTTSSDSLGGGYCAGLIMGISSTQIVYSEYLPKKTNTKYVGQKEQLRHRT